MSFPRGVVGSPTTIGVGVHALPAAIPLVCASEYIVCGMSFAIAGLVSQKSISIVNTKNIATSFPTFVSLLREQGAEIFEV